MVPRDPVAFSLFYNTRKKIKEYEAAGKSRGRKRLFNDKRAYQQRGLWALLRKPLETFDSAPASISARNVFVVQRVCLIVLQWNNSISCLKAKDGIVPAARKTVRPLTLELRAAGFFSVWYVSSLFFFSFFLFFSLDEVFEQRRVPLMSLNWKFLQGNVKWMSPCADTLSSKINTKNIAQKRKTCSLLAQQFNHSEAPFFFITNELRWLIVRKVFRALISKDYSTVISHNWLQEPNDCKWERLSLARY